MNRLLLQAPTDTTGIELDKFIGELQTAGFSLAEFYHEPDSNDEPTIEQDAHFPKSEWRDEVVEGNTNLGYWCWVEHQRASYRQRQPGDPLGEECTHDIDEDCMNCRICGECSESLDDDDVCSECKGEK
jgi:hypothetical protein